MVQPVPPPAIPRISATVFLKTVELGSEYVEAGAYRPGGQGHEGRRDLGFLEGFKRPIWRRMRIYGVRVATWSASDLAE